MISVICARSGGKRIKNKNIVNFFGKPIIYYPIKLAKKNKFITTNNTYDFYSSKRNKPSQRTINLVLSRAFIKMENWTRGKASAVS